MVDPFDRHDNNPSATPFPSPPLPVVTYNYVSSLGTLTKCTHRT